jgi:hypothetical protein
VPDKVKGPGLGVAGVAPAGSLLSLHATADIDPTSNINIASDRSGRHSASLVRIQAPLSETVVGGLPVVAARNYGECDRGRRPRVAIRAHRLRATAPPVIVSSTGVLPPKLLLRLWDSNRQRATKCVIPEFRRSRRRCSPRRTDEQPFVRHPTVQSDPPGRPDSRFESNQRPTISHALSQFVPATGSFRVSSSRDAALVSLGYRGRHWSGEGGVGG